MISFQIVQSKIASAETPHHHFLPQLERSPIDISQQRLNLLAGILPVKMLINQKQFVEKNRLAGSNRRISFLG